MSWANLWRFKLWSNTYMPLYALCCAYLHDLIFNWNLPNRRWQLLFCLSPLRFHLMQNVFNLNVPRRRWPLITGLWNVWISVALWDCQNLSLKTLSFRLNLSRILISTPFDTETDCMWRQQHNSAYPDCSRDHWCNLTKTFSTSM